MIYTGGRGVGLHAGDDEELIVGVTLGVQGRDVKLGQSWSRREPRQSRILCSECCSRCIIGSGIGSIAEGQLVIRKYAAQHRHQELAQVVTLQKQHAPLSVPQALALPKYSTLMPHDVALP